MQILGLHHDRPFIRWAVLRVRSKKVELQSLKSFIPASPEDVKLLYMDETKDRVVTGIKSLVRQLEFKISSKRKIEDGLPFQVESLTHLSLDQLVFSSQISPKKNSASATIFLASKETLSAHLGKLKEFSIDPDLVSAIPQALLRFTQFRCPDFQDGFVIYLGSEEWICVWMKQGIVQKSFVIEEGIESLLHSLWEDRKKVLFPTEVNGVAKQIDLFQLKPNLNPLLSKRLESLRFNLSGVLHSFQQTAGSLPVFFTGRTDCFNNLCPYLLETSPEIQMYNPPLPINLEEQKSAIAIGLGLEAMANRSSQVQFLRGEFIPAKRWKKAGFNALCLMASSFILSLGIWAAGMSRLDFQKEVIASSLKEVVGQMDPLIVPSLFKDGIEIGISQAMRVIQKYDKEAPFLLQAPTVTEVLAWLSNHPVVDTLTKTGDPLGLINLNYQLVSFPRIGTSRDPYLAKVEMEFSVKHSMSARKFHEELLKGDYLVDPNQEISWESLTDGYRVSFYLKNRTPYVS